MVVVRPGQGGGREDWGVEPRQVERGKTILVGSRLLQTILPPTKRTKKKKKIGKTEKCSNKLNNECMSGSRGGVNKKLDGRENAEIGNRGATKCCGGEKKQLMKTRKRDKICA